MRIPSNDSLSQEAENMGSRKHGDMENPEEMTREHHDDRLQEQPVQMEAGKEDSRRDRSPCKKLVA